DATAVNPSRTLVLDGGAGDDTFVFRTSGIASRDTIAGGAGQDKLLFATAGTIAAAAFAHIGGVDEIDLTNGANRLTLSDALVAASDNKSLTVAGGVGSDTIDARAVGPSRTLVLDGGAGKDTFELDPAQLTASDRIAGGTGRDYLSFTSAGTIAAAALAQVGGVDAIALSGGTNSLTVSAAVAAQSDSHLLTVYGDRTTGALTVDASAVGADDRVSLVAGAGPATLRGGAGNDAFKLTGRQLSADDTIAGGAGTDYLWLTLPGVTAASAFAHVGGIDRIYLANGVNQLTLSDALVAASDNDRLIVVGGAGNDTIDATAVDPSRGLAFNSDGGSDTFVFTASGLSANDTINASGGYNRLVLATAGAIGAAAFAHVDGVREIDLAGETNSLTVSDAMVTQSDHHLLVVDGHLTTTGLAVDASGVGAGNAVIIVAGAGADTLQGGAGKDTFELDPAQLTASDRIAGGAERDYLSFTAAGTIAASAFAQVGGIDAIALSGGTNSLTVSA
ncbi:MAG TPA: hypothetical protein VFQ80_11295, partial [Thermomicrobiales bacterium]|nr:hypothetical protein [Thermomicrobiales bacterium]